MNPVRVSMKASAQVLATFAFLLGKKPSDTSCMGPICCVSVRNVVSMVYISTMSACSAAAACRRSSAELR